MPDFDIDKGGKFNVDGIPYEFEQSFIVSLDADFSFEAFTFPKAFATGSTVVVVCTPTYQTSVWITSITVTGFTVNVGTQSTPYAADIHVHARSEC